jgi:hypothetical protein
VFSVSLRLRESVSFLLPPPGFFLLTGGAFA